MRLERTQQLIALPYLATAIYRPVVTVAPSLQSNLSFLSLLAPLPKEPKPKSQKNTLQPPLYFCSNFSQKKERTLDGLLYERPIETYRRYPLSNQAAFRIQAHGTLRRSFDGYFYLKASSSLLSLMSSYLPDDVELEKEAQIGVMIPKEYERYKLWQQVTETGKRFYFGIQGFYEIDLIEHPHIESLWGFKIESESLEKLREKYNLLPKIHHHEFFLVVAMKKRDRKKEPSGAYRIHPGVYPI